MKMRNNKTSMELLGYWDMALYIGYANVGKQAWAEL